MTYALTYGDYAPDALGVTVQDRIQSLEQWRNLCVDIESDARQKAEKATEDIKRLRDTSLEAQDDEL
jgi:hypothetical protein